MEGGWRAQKEDVTLGGEAKRLNSEVLMLTDRGLMLNLRMKTGQWFAEAAGKFTHTHTQKKQGQTIWRGVPTPPGERGTRREYGSLQTPLKRTDSSE